MQRLTYVVFISFAHYYGSSPYQPCVMPAGQLAISLMHLSSSQNNDRGLWYGNKTTCAHAYKIRKWHPSQRTTAGQCCEQLYRLEAIKPLSGRRACTVISISFVLK